MSGSADQADKLLAMAREDIAIARLVDREDLSQVGVGFHAQQAVEKALKAVIAEREGDFPFTHDIEALIEVCEKAGLEPPTDVQAAQQLSPYAGATRYGLGDPNAVAPTDAIRLAEATLEWAEATLSARDD